MKAEEFAIFDMYGEAVLAVNSADKIVYANESARNLFGEERLKAKASRTFPEILPENPPSSYVGSVSVGERTFTASVCEAGKYRIISVLRPSENEEHGMPVLLEAVAATVKSDLSSQHMALGLMRSRVQQYNDGKLDYYISAIDHSYHRVIRIVDNIEKLSGERHTEMSISCFDVIEHCREVIDTVSYLSDKYKLSFEFESDTDRMLFYGDKNVLDTIILQLLSNSIKYSPAKGTIKLSVKNAGNGVVFTVSDTGSGIPGDVLATVFERYKYPRKNYDEKEGVGLGLGVVRKLARRHGGSVIVDTKAGKGTNITVALEDKRNEAGTTLKSPTYQYNNDIYKYLIGLSDVLDMDVYTNKNQD